MIKEYRLKFLQIQAVKNGEDIITDDGVFLRNEMLTEPPYHARSFAYCSDTAYYEKNMSLLQNVDLLYHEATFLDADRDLAKITGHSTALQAAKLAQKSAAGKLLIGHFSNRYKYLSAFLNEARSVFPETELAEELKTYTIPLRREKRLLH